MWYKNHINNNYWIYGGIKYEYSILRVNIFKGFIAMGIKLSNILFTFKYLYGRNYKKEFINIFKGNKNKFVFQKVVCQKMIGLRCIEKYKWN